MVKSSRGIDARLVDELGATAKGMFALEHLLFDRKSDPPEAAETTGTSLQLLSGPDSFRRGAYLLAVSRDVAAKAAQLANDWSTSGDAAAKFVAGGQASVNLLVNQLATAIEDAAEGHLNFVLGLPAPVMRQLDRFEGSPSGSSLPGVLTYLEGAQALYRGTKESGLEHYLAGVNPSLKTRLREQFEAAIAATRAIGAPLEQAVVDNPAAVQDAYEKTRALEILFKVDLASALGVTLTFNSNDGD